jgi:hypothetical protein
MKIAHAKPFIAGTIAGLLIIIIGAALHDNDRMCRDRYFIMESVYRCIHESACLVLAEDMLKARRAAKKYEMHCQDFERRRSFEQQPSEPKPEGSSFLETSLDSRYTST